YANAGVGLTVYVMPGPVGVGLVHRCCFLSRSRSELSPLSLHDALPISCVAGWPPSRSPCRCCSGWESTSCRCQCRRSRPSKRWRSEEHTSELQSLRHLVCRLLLEKKNSYSTHRNSISHAAEAHDGSRRA